MECGLLVGDGPFRRLSVEEAETYSGPGFLWLHLHGATRRTFSSSSGRRTFPRSRPAR
jgi:hypothetical protein